MSLSQKQNKQINKDIDIFWISNLMETNIILQKFANFNMCFLEYSNLRKQSLFDRALLSKMGYMKNWLIKLGTKLQHTFTHETGNLLHRVAVHLPIASHM